jgi:hypothetical protein
MHRTEIHNMLGVKDATLRLAGWLRLAAWCTLLYMIHSPWRELGGIVSERMRWSERFVLPMSVVIGCYAGSVCRSHALLPPAALAAVVMLALKIMRLNDVIGVVFTAFAAYWAGVDIAGGAYPMMMGDRGERPTEDENPPPWLGV